MKLRKVFLLIGCSLLVIYTSFMIGSNLGTYYKKIKEVKVKENNKKFILSKMNNLNIGDTIPNYYFEDLSFNQVELKPLVQSNTLLMFIEPNCYICLEEIECLSNALEQNNNIIVISSGNPRLLIDLRERYNLSMPILYDHNQSYSSIFGIFTFPFHMVINRNLEVLNIYTSKLEVEYFKNIQNAPHVDNRNYNLRNAEEVSNK